MLDKVYVCRDLRPRVTILEIDSWKKQRCPFVCKTPGDAGQVQKYVNEMSLLEKAGVTAPPSPKDNGDMLQCPSPYSSLKPNGTGPAHTG